MKKNKRRICIIPYDVEVVTGRSYRQSLRVLHEIADKLNKPVKFVTIEEFCNHAKLKKEEVEETIFGKEEEEKKDKKE